MNLGSSAYVEMSKKLGSDISERHRQSRSIHQQKAKAGRQSGIFSLRPLCIQKYPYRFTQGHFS